MAQDKEDIDIYRTFLQEKPCYKQITALHKCFICCVIQTNRSVAKDNEDIEITVFILIIDGEIIRTRKNLKWGWAFIGTRSSERSSFVKTFTTCFSSRYHGLYIKHKLLSQGFID